MSPIAGTVLSPEDLATIAFKLTEFISYHEQVTLSAFCYLSATLSCLEKDDPAYVYLAEVVYQKSGDAVHQLFLHIKSHLEEESSDILNYWRHF